MPAGQEIGHGPHLQRPEGIALPGDEGNLGVGQEDREVRESCAAARSSPS